jgi:hypothetical protein
MQRKWSGPYRVLQHNHLKPHRVLIETHPDLNLPYKKLVVHIDHVKIRKPYHGKASDHQGIGFKFQDRPDWVPSDPEQPVQQDQYDDISSDSDNEDSDDDNSDNDVDNNKGEDTSYLSGPGEGPANPADTVENTRENVMDVSGENVQIETDTVADQVQPEGTPQREPVPPEMFERRSLQSTSSQVSTPASLHSSRFTMSRASSTSQNSQMDVATPQRTVLRSPISETSSTTSIKSRLGPRLESPVTPPMERMIMPSRIQESVRYRVSSHGPEATIAIAKGTKDKQKSRSLTRRLGRFAYLEDTTVTPPTAVVNKRLLSPPTPETQQAEDKLKKPSKLSKLTKVFRPKSN